MTRFYLLLLFPFLLLGLLITVLRYLTCLFGNTQKAWHIALLIDETVNVDVNGRVNESISRRAAQAQVAGRKWGCLLCKFLDTIQPNHCEDTLKK